MTEMLIRTRTVEDGDKIGEKWRHKNEDIKMKTYNWRKKSTISNILPQWTLPSLGVDPSASPDGPLAIVGCIRNCYHNVRDHRVVLTSVNFARSSLPSFKQRSSRSGLQTTAFKKRPLSQIHPYRPGAAIVLWEETSLGKIANLHVPLLSASSSSLVVSSCRFFLRC